METQLQVETQIIERKIPAINFTVREYLGVEVLTDPGDPFDKTKAVTIKTRDGLKPGDKVLVPGLMGGYHRGVVTVDKRPGVFSVEGADFFGTIEFGTDDRNCWVCTGIGCRKALDRIKLD